jgi:quinol monooxygenase YgiN
MIVVAGTIPIRADAREAAIAAAVEMQTATLNEPGCQQYAFSFDVVDPCLVRLFEVWDDQESLDIHFTLPHMAAFQAKLGDIVAGAGDFGHYTVSAARPMFG